MKCERCEELVNAYVDGELSLPTAIAVALHARLCPGCAASLAETRRITHLAREWRQLPAVPKAPIPWRTITIGIGGGVALAVASTGAWWAWEVHRKGVNRFLTGMDGASHMMSMVFKGTPKETGGLVGEVMVYKKPSLLAKAEGWKAFGEEKASPSRQMLCGVAALLDRPCPATLNPIPLPDEVKQTPPFMEGDDRVAYGSGPIFIAEGAPESDIARRIVLWEKTPDGWRSVGYADVRYDPKAKHNSENEKKSEQTGFVSTPSIRELTKRP